MTMDSNSTPGNITPLEAVTRIAREVAAVHAQDVDKLARFPGEAIEALREAGVLCAQLPVGLGGAGLGMRDLGELVATLAESCASSAMVLAMHYSQLACLARHGLADPKIAALVSSLPDRPLLLASMTSEVGTSGETRRSICAVQRDGDTATLRKDATTGSYCSQADVILVTARRNADAAPNDQVLVLVKRDQRSLDQTSTWDTLGMRGTCSPGFHIEAKVGADQVLTTPFAEIAVQSMVPYSHILWAALWSGIATGAYRKAAAFIRQQARQTPGAVPQGSIRLAAMGTELQAMTSNWQNVANEFDAFSPGDTASLSSMRWALRMNNLKIGTSAAAPRLVHEALQIIGIAAYKNDGRYSLGREYRDALSGSLMISNDRLAAASASMLLVSKEI